jgi:hypothetical protein
MEKSREHNRPLWMLFLDYGNAYDRVDRDKLWETLYTYNIPKNLVNAIKTLYNNTKITVLTDANRTNNNSLPINTGIREDCGLTPAILSETFVVLLSPSRQIIEYYLKTGCDPSNSLCTKSTYSSMLCNIHSWKSFVKQTKNVNNSEVATNI